MKKIISLLIAVLFIASTVYSQVSVTTNVSYIKNAKKVEYKNGTYGYEEGLPFCYGTTITSVYTARIRSVASFPIPTSIPIGSQVYKVEFNFNPLGSIGFSVYYFENCPSSPTNEQAYELADDGSYVGSYSSSIGAYTETMPGSIVSAINNAVANSINTVYFGIISANEYINAGATQMSSLSLKIYYRRPISFSVRNNFNAGQININGTNCSSGSTVNTNEDLSQTFGAIEPQSNSGVNYVWNDTEGTLNLSDWERKKGNVSISKGTTQSITYTTIYDDDGCEFVANMRPRYNVTFQNSFTGVGNGGTISVNSTTYNSPTSTFQVVSQNAVQAAPQIQTINYIIYTFSHWNDGSTTGSRTFYPSSNTTYTATYVGIPDKTPMNAYLNSTETGQPVRITWTEHPLTSVTKYRIYRGAKRTSNLTSPIVIATVNRGTTSYTDNEYIVGGDDPGTVAYDVVPYYSTEGTWGMVGMKLVSATPVELVPKLAEENIYAAISKEIPSEYKLENYPNPFNPTTTISYQLPEVGMVTLKVYDMLGKEVATLVNEVKQAGYYSATFDASKLASGIYISTIQTNNFTQSKKMLLVK